MREILLLNLPAEPGLARLGRLAALHFLRQNGLPAGAARSGALRVGAGCRRLLRGAARGRRAAGGILLRMVAHSLALEVTGRRAGRRPSRSATLLRIERAAPL